MKSILIALMTLVSMNVFAVDSHPVTVKKAFYLLESNGYSATNAWPSFVQIVTTNNLPTGTNSVRWSGVASNETWTLADIELVNLPPDYKNDAEEIAANPVSMPNGVEVPVLVLITSEDKGLGLIASTNGAVVPIQWARESPYSNLAEKVESALSDWEASAEIVRAKGDQAKTDAAAAASIPALKDAVLLLQEQVEELRKMLRIN